MSSTSWLPDLSQASGPKYLALSRALREAIALGALPQGAQLPTVRDLAWDLKVTPGTVARAYQIATQEGLLAATVGRGTFVAASEPRIGLVPVPVPAQHLSGASLAGRLDFRSPRVPDVGQGEAFAEALGRVAVSAGKDWLGYPGQPEEAPLRAAVVDWLSDRILGPLQPDDIALAHGGQNALSLIFQSTLRGDRPVVLLEELAYPGFRFAARMSRAETVPLETDDRGLIPEALEAACRRQGAQVLCITPEAQNPTTAHMDRQRREEIVAIARTYDLQIVEDECYTTVRTDAPAIRALAPERTWFVGSLSKTISPALRFGYIACPPGRGEAARLAASYGFFGLARPVTDLVLDLFRSGMAALLRTRVQAAFSERLQAAVNALGRHDIGWQPGLPFLWMSLPSGWRNSTFLRMAEAEGILLRSADEYALVTARAPHGIRLALNGRLSRAATEDACNRLSLLLESPLREVAV